MAEPAGVISPAGDVCRPDPQGRQGGRAPPRATDDRGAPRHPEDGEGPRARDPAGGVGTGGPGGRVTQRRLADRLLGLLAAPPGKIAESAISCLAPSPATVLPARHRPPMQARNHVRTHAWPPRLGFYWTESSTTTGISRSVLR